MDLMSLIKQPNIFAVKFLTNVCLTLQLSYLIPEEAPALFSGELTIPAEDKSGRHIEYIDEVLASLPILSDEDIESFQT